MSIYLDYAATTAVLPEVRAAMQPYWEEQFGNPSSMHHFGRATRLAIDHARSQIAQELGCAPQQIVFTSGGTEADNVALLGVALARRAQGKDHVITTQVEHHAVLDTCQYLQRCGFSVTYLPVDATGQIDIATVRQHISERTALISVMYANNEVGTRQPIRKLSALAREYGVLLHTDAVQALGLEKLDIAELGVDLLTLSAHKIGGPKGIGALYMADHVQLVPRAFGGSQELRRRPGTENVPGIVGFGQAVEQAAATREEHRLHMQQMRALLLQRLTEKTLRFTVNGHEQDHLSHICNISFPELDAETMLISLDLAGVAAASGSACTSGSLQQSHVLTAMQLPTELTRSAIRFSFGTTTTVAEIEQTVDIIADILARLK